MNEKCRPGDSAPSERLDGHAAPRGADVAEEEREALVHLAAVVAHQLKSPLSAVQTVLSTVIGGFAGPLQPRQRWLLEKAWGRCTHGVSLVQDLLKLRSIEQMGDDALGPVNLLATFSMVVDSQADGARRRNVQVESFIDLTEPVHAWIHAERTVVGEAFAVVLDNAVRYSVDGGKVSARLYSEPMSEERGGGVQVCVEVVDAGIGIPPEGYTQIFAEFYRSPEARTMSPDGTGLGLAFASRAVRRLGGRIKLEPADTGGVRAVICFAHCPECATEAEAPLPSLDEPMDRDGEDGPSLRVVVVGGVTAGSKAAAKIMRCDPRARVTIVERGRFLAYSGCGLPYYVSGAVPEQRMLLETPLGLLKDPTSLYEHKRVRTMDLTEAVRIDRQQKTVWVRGLLGGEERELPYDRLILATGASAVVPDLEGSHLPGIYTLHGVEDAEAIRDELASGRVKEVIIVGGGLLGCQITEAVVLRGARLTLVEAGSAVLPIVDEEIGSLVRGELERHGVRVLTGRPVTGFEGEERVRAVRLGDGSTLPCDFVLLTAGLRPEAELAEQAGLKLGSSGAVAVDSTLRTSDPSIYAVGDCAEQLHLVTGIPTWSPGAAAASIQGRIAAVNACGGDESYPGLVETLIVKIFDWGVARTGLTEAQARDSGLAPVCAVVPGPDRAHFIPTAKSLVLKLVVDRESRRVLGAQAVGPGEVAKRIDTVATALMAGMTVDNLACLNLAYAPPYSMVMDNVIVAANVVRDKLTGAYSWISSGELNRRLARGEEVFLLDVRLPTEYGATRLRGSRHIPLATVRSHLRELPHDTPIVIVCSLGLRSYEASLILQQHGFDNTLVLDGGLDAWPFAVERLT
ncbi:MAG: FAD-dependent oxidoreductase [Acidobacteria bacterium]|nr:FAD-dependent oxidoreductase [Acidobacteriota bacterium]